MLMRIIGCIAEVSESHAARDRGEAVSQLSRDCIADRNLSSIQLRLSEPNYYPWGPDGGPWGVTVWLRPPCILHTVMCATTWSVACVEKRSLDPGGGVRGSECGMGKLTHLGMRTPDPAAMRMAQLGWWR